MSIDRERLAALAQEILSRPVDWEKLAAAEAARTDPWRWYCRLCGAKGDAGSEDARDHDAAGHLGATACGQYGVTGMARSGRLLHVWTYPLTAWRQDPAQGDLRDH